MSDENSSNNNLEMILGALSVIFGLVAFFGPVSMVIGLILCVAGFVCAIWAVSKGDKGPRVLGYIGLLFNIICLIAVLMLA